MSSQNQAELGGMLSNKVRLRTVSNRIELVKPGKRKERPLTPNQESHRETFQRAARYASRQIKDGESRALYAKGINDKKRTAFQVAVSDSIVAPKVNLIDANHYNGSVGSTIEVKAVDDFMVTKVMVTIRSADGSLIEEGEAKQDQDNFISWLYTATVANPSEVGSTIQASAFDRPGNVTSLTKVL